LSWLRKAFTNRNFLDERGNVLDQEELLNDLHWRIRDVRARQTAIFMFAQTRRTDVCCGASRQISVWA
jgi:hypothetical protein